MWRTKRSAERTGLVFSRAKYTRQLPTFATRNAIHRLLRPDRSGSAMVESAIYMPMIVLCIMFTIYMMLNMYSQTALQAHLHLMVQAESGKIAGVTESPADNGGKGAYDRYRSAAFAKTINVGSGSSGSSKVATASVSQRYYGGRMTRAGGLKVRSEARSYAIKEIGDIRNTLRM